MIGLVGVIGSHKSPPRSRSQANSGNIASGTLTYTETNLTRVANDQLIVTIMLNNTAATIATPTDWALDAAFPINTSGTGTNRRIYAFTRTADGSPLDLPTWTKTGTGSWSVCSSSWGKTLGIDVQGVAVSTGAADTSAILPSVTPTTEYTTLAAHVMADGPNPITPSARWTELLDSSNPRQQVTRRSPWTSGATPADTFTISSASKWAAVVFALKRKM